MSKQQAGFSAVELLITLFVAAGFLVAAYQLYNVIVRDGGATHQRAVVSNMTYDYLRQYEATVPETCSASTPLDDEPLFIDGVGNTAITVAYTCPMSSDLTVTRVTVTINYGNNEQVSYATFARSSAE